VSTEGEERLGELVGGRYELRDVLGHGGQSVIYRAKDQVDGDDVAVKMLKHARDKDAVDRLFREAQALVALAGTAALRVLHQTVTDDGAACLVTELLRGQDLTDHLADVEAAGGRMSRQEIVQTFEPIVRTIDAAHAQGIIHRDIKPENIFVIHPAYGGGVRLLDFGFSRFMQLRRLTEPGMVAGSPLYLAPEVWSGREIDGRVDVYSLGVLLFRVLGGKVPFSGRIHELLDVVRRAPRPSLRALRPDLPEDIDAWASAALAVDPDERFQKARALWHALLQCLPEESPKTTRISAP
jgi:eukaryotic-like serine/threonine-protein kinase